MAGTPSPTPLLSTVPPVLRPQLLSSIVSPSGRPGGERVPIAAIGLAGRRVNGFGEAATQKESMNCKSCRKKKIKCNRMRPSCGACLAFQCACIYDAIPKKRGPKTEVLEELLKRVSGLEKKLQEEKEANMARQFGNTKARKEGLPIESTADAEKTGQSSTSDENHLAKCEPKNEGHGATNFDINQHTTSVRSSDPDSEPPPYASLSPAPADLMTGIDISWASSNLNMDTSQVLAMKRRRTSDAETISVGLEPSGVPLLKKSRSTAQMQLNSAPEHVSPAVQFPDSYVDAYFREFHAKPHELLHEETFRAELAQGAIHPSQLHIVCALGAKYVHSGERGHSLCVQFTEAARAAVDMDFPSFQNFQTILLISVSYFYLGKGYKTFMLLGTAVRMAYGLDLNRELPANAPVTPVQREVMRRAFWACYLLDCFTVCGSKRPPMLREESILLKLPSSMPQMRGLDEQFFSSHVGLPGSGTGQMRVGGLLAPWRQGDNASALCIDITKLLGTTIRYIEQGGVKGDIHFPWHTQSNLTKIRRELDNWSARTSELYAQTPGAAPGEGLYLRHPDVTLLVMAKAIFHLVSCLIYRPFLAVELPGKSKRAHQGMTGNGTRHGPEAGQQQNWQAEATKMCFVHANAIGDLVELLNNTQPEGFQWPAILGYCVLTAATVHLHGAHYKNMEHEEVMRTSKAYFEREIQQLHDFHDKWPAARVQHMMLKRLSKAHEKLVQRLAETSNSRTASNHCGMGIAGGSSYTSGAGYWAGYAGTQNVFQLDDFFERYPNREEYFDGAQCPFVEDMFETAAKLNFQDELGEIEQLRTQIKRTTHEVYAGVPAPHVMISSGNGNTHTISHDMQDLQQYTSAQTYPASRSHRENNHWESHRQKGPDSISSPNPSTSRSDYGQMEAPSPVAMVTSAVEQSSVNTPRSTPAPVPGTFDNTMENESGDRYDAFSMHTFSHSTSRQQTTNQMVSMHNPSGASAQSMHNDPPHCQATFQSSQPNNNWFSSSGDNHAPSNTSQNSNSRMEGFDIHSANSDLPQRGDIHPHGYSVQDRIYADHSNATSLNTETTHLGDTSHIQPENLIGSGVQLHEYNISGPDPFLLVLTQMVEQRNNNYGNLNQQIPMHSTGAEVPTHMSTGFQSHVSNSETAMLQSTCTGSHVQPMGSGTIYGSHAEVDPTRPTAMNMTTGMEMEGYNTSWMHPGVHY